MAAAETVRKVYRELYHIVRQQSKSSHKKTKQFDGSSLKELRESFRLPLSEGESVENRLAGAESRLAFLRISTVKQKPRGQSGRWVYQNGKPLSGEGTSRIEGGRVVSNWDGKNLDPESVTTHRKQLRRAGFVNNQHAKGVF
jgi:hypothetical protein